MNREQIIAWAHEAGYQHPDAVGQCEDFAYFDIERFAQLVAAAERQEILKMCEPPEHSHQFVHTFKKLIAARGQQ